MLRELSVVEVSRSSTWMADQIAASLHWISLLRGGRRPVHAAFPAARLVGRTGGVQALPAVRAAADNFAVVVVLAVVFPPTLAADVIAAALVKGRVTAAGARIRLRPGRGKDVPLRDVGVEPGSPSREEFLVRETRIIPWASSHRSLRWVAVHAIQYDSKGMRAHIALGDLPRSVAVRG
jgi:hypothetical protein